MPGCPGFAVFRSLPGMPGEQSTSAGKSGFLFHLAQVGGCRTDKLYSLAVYYKSFYLEQITLFPWRRR